MICPIVLYTDDTSGNKSKKWNKFDCMLVSQFSQPTSENGSPILQHTCSNRMSALDMTGALVDELLLLEGVVIYNSYVKRMCL